MNRTHAEDYWVSADVERTTSGTVSIPVPAHTLVKEVYARVVESYDSATSAALEVGDASDADGFLVSADAKAAAGTIYGDALSEWGVYLKELDSGGADSVRNAGKYYDTASNIVCTITITGATTKGRVRVFARLVTLGNE